MEQPAGKKLRAVLGAGLLAALALAAAQRFSPLASALYGGRDLRVALLSDTAAAVLVYHPATGVVNAVSFPKLRARKGVSGYQRASELAALTGAASPPVPGDVFYVALSSAPDLEALWPWLNDWRSEPRRFAAAAGWVRRLRAEGATNITPFGLFCLFSEFSRLTSADFILTESRRGGEEELPEEPAAEPAAPAVRVEVFNASGRKGLAEAAAKCLRAAGFDVLTASSYGKIEKHSKLECFTGDTAPAQKLRAALGLGELAIKVNTSGKSVAEASVILGADFDASALKKAAGDGPR